VFLSSGCVSSSLQKTNLKRINPAGAFRAQLELADYRKKHIKVVLVSGIFAIGFVVCMLPTSFSSPTMSSMILLT